MYHTCGHDFARSKLDQGKMKIDLPHHMLCACAGNRMHLGNVGFCMLMASLCLAPTCKIIAQDNNLG